MVDLHAHVLPGLDDGPADVGASLALLAALRDQDVSDVVCTPHLPPPGAFLPDAGAFLAALERRDRVLERLRAAAAAAGLGIRLHAGAELLLAADLLSLLPAILGPCGLAGTPNVLVEVPTDLPGWLEVVDRMLFRIQLAGAVPVLAHPERLALPPAGVRTLVEWAEQGRVRLLLDAGSLLPADEVPSGRREANRRRRSLAERLLDAGAVFAVASDAHDAATRPPRLDRACRAVAARWGADAAERLFVLNPYGILEEGKGGGAAG